MALAASSLAPRGRLVWIAPFPARARAIAERGGLRLDWAETVDMGGFDAEMQRWIKVVSAGCYLGSSRCLRRIVRSVACSSGFSIRGFCTFSRKRAALGVNAPPVMKIILRACSPSTRAMAS